MRTAVVVYSLGGTSRRLAEAMAARSGGTVVPIACARYRPGGLSYARAAVDSVMGWLPAVAVAEADLAGFDAVAIGGPVWAGRASTPLRAFLAARPALPRRVGLFVTFGGSGAEGALAQMRALLRRTPVAEYAATEAEVRAGMPAGLPGFLARLAGHGGQREAAAPAAAAGRAGRPPGAV